MAARVCDGIADTESFVCNVDEPEHVVVAIFLIMLEHWELSSRPAAFQLRSLKSHPGKIQRMILWGLPLLSPAYKEFGYKEPLAVVSGDRVMERYTEWRNTCTV